MILVDANLLLYAKFGDYPQHERCLRWFTEKLNGSRRVGLPWASLLAFLRIATNPRVFERPMPTKLAWDQVEARLRLPTTWIHLPTPDHVHLLGHLIVDSGASSSIVPDAHLAALALEHGLILCSADSDFARFPELRWENPLATR